MKINFIDLQTQYQEYKEEIDEQIKEVLDSSGYIMGPKVAQLEGDLASFVGAKHAIACSSGTDALILTLLALDIKAGDEIITSPFTFFATAEVIAFVGATPVFVDIDENNFNIDTSKIENKITAKTRAIIPVSLFGQVADMDQINLIAKNHNLVVIEDAAQSFGAEYKGRKSCNVSDLACTSFFPAKPLGCYGDGGAVFTSNDELENRMRILLNHGQTKRYVHSHIGINGRLDAIQAGILMVKLKHYDKEIERRQKIVKNYNENLKNVITPYIEQENLSVWAQYCIRVPDRDKMLAKCTNNNVPTGVYYPIPVHLQEAFHYLGYQKGDLPITEKVSKDIMALPMSAYVTEEEQNYIIGVVNE